MKFKWETLIPEVRINGKWLTAEEAADQGIFLSRTAEKLEDSVFLRIFVKNNSGKSFNLDKINWKRTGEHQDILNRNGIKVYLEGWQMASPCGVRQFGDRDFNFSNGYMPYAMCEPSDFSREPNHFRAENVVMFHDDASGESLLTGFVTSADQFGHFTIELAETGLKELNIRCACDGMLVENGECVHSETLAVMEGTDGYELLAKYAKVWGTRMHARTKIAPPVGWCSWYYYFANVTEKDVYENVEFIAKNRNDYPLKYIQLDDGYQSALGDWLICNEKFPHGLEGVVKSVRDNGFIPALWLGPFMAQDDSVLLKEHPEWMIHDASGNVIMQFGWRENHKAAVLDGTHPEVQEHFRQLFSKIRKLGFDYVKLDFLVTAVSMKGGIFYDKKATRCQALRRGMQAIRDGFGEDGYILGCTVPFAPMVGLVDGERISTDITPYWVPDHEYFEEAPTVPYVCRNVIRHTYMHRKLWNNDPDTLIVRDDSTKLTENEVLLWYNAVRLCGGMLLLSDRFSTLKQERAELPIALLKDVDAFETRPADFWSNEIPAVWRGVHRADGAVETGLFNFDDTEKTINGEKVPAHSVKLIKD